ncbi:protein FAM200A-like [Stegodyphus dumicola]|uniref:protein FAM200A-like n=1 Tax=Stegodyphus dumicola TaxID=202533 RepID=UPI0015B109BB|nr:protein FAM200A-like [Stegodyphus dumicola]
MVRENNPSINPILCVIHRQALAPNKLPSERNDVLQLCIRIGNHVIKNALNTRLFTVLCEDLGTGYKTLLFHTEECWFIKGNMLARLIKFPTKMVQVLEIQNQSEFYVEFRKPGVQVVLVYLSDILDSLKSLNLKLQGVYLNIIHHLNDRECTDKLKLWECKILACN